MYFREMYIFCIHIFLFFLVTLIWNKSIFQDVSKQDGRTIQRRYCIAAWRYEISLLMLKKYFTSERSETSEIFSTLTEKFHISKQPRNVVLIYYINTNEIPNHFTYNKQFFGVKGRIYYVAIATVIFSHVKISSFRAKAPLLFHWCLYNNLSFYLWK